MTEKTNEQSLILIDDEYAISVDSIDYSLRKIRYNKKSGKRETTTIGYFSSVPKCLTSYLNEKTHDAVDQCHDISISEAMKLMGKALDEARELIEKSFPEYEVVKK